MNIYAGTPTASPTAGTAIVVTPCVGGGQNSETYWVGSSNLLPATRSKSIQARRTNDFCSASIVTKNYTEVLMYEKKISLDKSKSNITLTSWIDLVCSYTEDKKMNTVFCVYYIDLKSEAYLLYE